MTIESTTQNLQIEVMNGRNIKATDDTGTKTIEPSKGTNQTQVFTSGSKFKDSLDIKDGHSFQVTPKHMKFASAVGKVDEKSIEQSMKASMKKASDTQKSIASQSQRSRKPKKSMLNEGLRDQVHALANMMAQQSEVSNTNKVSDFQSNDRNSQSAALGGALNSNPYS